MKIVDTRFILKKNGDHTHLPNICLNFWLKITPVIKKKNAYITSPFVKSKSLWTNLQNNNNNNNNN